MKLDRIGVALVVATCLVGLASCGAGSGTAPVESDVSRPVVKGGDGRAGAYQGVEGWWKPAPDHEGPWTWGQVSGVAVDNPDRIIVAVWGDRNADGEEREGSSNYLVVVDRNGNVIENWSQWDSTLNKPHQVYISPYDPERHVWVVERGGGRGVHMQVLKFTNDGSELVMRLGDPDHPTTREEARANPNPGPFTYGEPSVMAFLPDGSFLLGDGYWNTRIVKYDADGEYVMEWGEAGSGPGQFDLVHGLAVDHERRVYVADRRNNRVQLFDQTGRYVETFIGDATLSPMARDYMLTNSYPNRLREMADLEPQKRLRSPRSVTVLDDGRMFIPDFASFRVQVYQKEAIHLTEGQITPPARSPSLQTT